ncbi:MAG: N-6 DNA methylase [Nitrosomonas sp.]|nr:N-6 DNA methylase [Nitrosomonadaceae bacterium]
MITGVIKNQVNQIWNTFWSGGMSNPPIGDRANHLPVICQAPGRELHTAKAKQASLPGEPINNPIFEPQQSDLRWSRFKDFNPERKFAMFRDQMFTFIKSLNGRAGSACTRFMKYAAFIIPTPALLNKVTNMIYAIPMHDRDTKGDLYEYIIQES